MILRNVPTSHSPPHKVPATPFYVVTFVFNFAAFPLYKGASKAGETLCSTPSPPQEHPTEPTDSADSTSTFYEIFMKFKYVVRTSLHRPHHHSEPWAYIVEHAEEWPLFHIWLVGRSTRPFVGAIEVHQKSNTRVLNCSGSVERPATMYAAHA